MNEYGRWVSHSIGKNYVLAPVLYLSINHLFNTKHDFFSSWVVGFLSEFYKTGLTLHIMSFLTVVTSYQRVDNILYIFVILVDGSPIL